MKKQLLAIGIVGAAIFAFNANANDPVLMNVAGTDIRLSEFEYLYNKNNAQQVQPQSLDEYVEMFVNYKLKVADAVAAGLDTTQAFVDEYNKFRSELAAPYMRDQAAFDSIVAQAYEHLSTDVLVSHIMMQEGSEVLLDSLRTAILENKTTFEDVAAQYSIDGGSKTRGGLMGYVMPNRYPWAFEEAAYNTAVGDISQIVNSGFGIHLIRVESKTPARGQVLVEHILRITRGMPDSVAVAEKCTIDSLYQVLTSSDANFGEIAMQYSQDPGSARRGGKLDWFGVGMMVPEFEKVSFELNNGEISQPFQTSFGWHIIHKLDSRSVGTFEENYDALIGMIEGTDRASAARLSFLNKMIRKYDASVINDNVAKITANCEQYGERLDSAMFAAFATSDLDVIKVNGKKIKFNEVASLINVAPLKGEENICNYLVDELNKIMCNFVLDVARDELAENNADYRNLINEYRDGILLFEISNRNVWERAGRDKEALEAYFQRNIDKYAWSVPKFKSFIIFTQTDSLLNEAVNYAATLPQDLAATDFVQQMRQKFGKDVKVERVIAAKGENQITDYLAFGGIKPQAENSRWSCYAAFRGRVILGPEEASDVRGAVVSDFQNELERQWIETLRAKYPVKIYKKVLKKIK